MQKFRWLSRNIVISAWLLIVLGTGAGRCFASDQSVSGEDLSATVQDDLTTEVSDGEDLESVAPIYYNTFLNLGEFDIYNNPIVYSGLDNQSAFLDQQPFVTVSNITNEEPDYVDTTVTCGGPSDDDVTLDQQISIRQDGNAVQHVWTLTNSSDTDYPNVSLAYGGSTDFDPEESEGLGIGFASLPDIQDGGIQNGEMVYTIDPDNVDGGFMGLISDPSYEINSYYQDDASNVISDLTETTDNGTSLPDSVSVFPQDSGMGLQWGTFDLPPDSTVVITAYEVFDGSDQGITVSDPEGGNPTTVQDDSQGAVQSFTFSVENYIDDDGSDTYQLYASGAPNGPGNITVTDIELGSELGDGDSFNPGTDLTGTAGFSVPPTLTLQDGDAVDITVSFIADPGLDGNENGALLSFMAYSTFTGVAAQVTDQFQVQAPPPPPVMVTSDGPTTAYPDIQTTYTFTVQNNEGESDDFMLDFETSGSATIVGEPPADVGIEEGDGGTAQVSVTVISEIPGEDGSPEITLTATGEQTDDTASATQDISLYDIDGAVVVTPPTQPQTYAGIPVTIDFTIANTTSALDDTYQITVTPDPGIDVTSALSEDEVAIDHDSSITFPVTFTASTALIGQTVDINVQAISDTSSDYQDSEDFSTTFEAVTNPVTITSPATAAATTGTPTTITFAITNTGLNADTFTLTPNLGSGITVTNVQETGNDGSLLEPIALSAGEQGSVVLTVIGSAALGGTTGAVGLTATSQDFSDFSNAATTQVAFTAPSVQVSPPSNQNVLPGAPVTITFEVSNQEVIADTYSLLLEFPTGVTVTSAVIRQGLTQSVRSVALRRGTGSTSLGLLALEPDTDAFIDVTFTVSPSLSGEDGTVSLVATSTANDSVTSTGSLDITFHGAPANQSGAAATVASPSVPVSSGQIFFTPLSPSTPQGVADLLSVLAAANGNAIGYAWDASAQSYTQLPTQPVGGLLPTGGVFIASVVPLALDFSGTSLQLPVSISLAPGWNLIGIPPIDAGAGVVLTTHDFPGSFNLLDTTGSLVQDVATFSDTLGTVGSDAVATASPYLYSHGAFTQVTTLQTGVAYWIKNNSTGPVTLERVSSGTVLSAVATTRAVHTAASPQYIDRGQPPAAPTSAMGSGSSDDGHGGCGLSASGVLMGVVLVLGLRRRALVQR